MQPIMLDLRDVDNINIAQLGQPLRPAPPRHAESQTKRQAYQAAVDLWGMFHPGALFYRQPADVAEHPPHINVRPPTKVPTVPRSAATISVGISTALFAGVGFTSAVGIYGATTKEFGVFYGTGLGIWSSIGASTGPQYTFVFGGPSAFAGVSWGVGCDVDAGPVGIGAMLLFTLPPFRFIGYSVSFSVGTPSPPVTVTVQMGMTMTKPVLKIR